MSDEAVLFLVLVLLYLSECFVRISKGSAVLYARHSGSWSFVFPERLYSSSRSAYFFNFPLPPLGTAFPCAFAPILISPYGIVRRRGGGEMTWDSISAVGTSDAALRINGTEYIFFDTPLQSVLYKNLIRDIVQTAAADRPGKLKSFIRRSLDHKECRERIILFKRKVLPLRVIANLIFIYLFIILPIFIFKFGFMMIWPVPLIILAGLVIAAIFLFYDIHRRLFRDDKAGRWSAMAIMILYLPFSIRAVDIIARAFWPDKDILSVGSSVLSEDAFRNLASDCIRQMMFLPGSSLTDEGRETGEWFASEYIVSAGEILKSHGMTIEDCLSVPEPEDDLMKSYCPRCLAQYVMDCGPCPDCGTELKRIK